MSRNESAAASPSRRYHDWYGGERRQSWATPPAFFAPLHAEFKFTLDGASATYTSASSAREPALASATLAPSRSAGRS